MINQERKDMNHRFCQVFRELQNRGVIKKNDRGGKGIRDIARVMLDNESYGHIIRSMLDGKRFVNHHQVRKFCTHFSEYSLNELYITEGIAPMFYDDNHQFDLRIPTSLSPVSSGNIIFTSIEAFAGASIDSGSFKTEEHTTFSLPGLSGSGLVAFPIKGNSMEPIIHDGDIVICRQIASVSEIRDNQIYAVRNNGQVWVKYVQPIRNAANRIVKLKLLSANYIEHDPFVEEVDERTQIFKLVRRITEL